MILHVVVKKEKKYCVSVGPIGPTFCVNIENHNKKVPPFVYRITLFHVSISAPVFNYRGAAAVSFDVNRI